MANKTLTGTGLAEFAKGKIGTSYVYGAKGADGKFTQNRLNVLAAGYPNVFTPNYIAKASAKVGKICTDCSGLPSWYTGHVLGSSQLYAQAYTRLPIANVKDFAPGTILWKNGHVGVYIGLENGVPMCMEAKGIAYGTVKSKVSATKWKNGLTFSWITYSYTTNLASTATYKGSNPYAQPTATVKYIKAEVNVAKESVKWLQWELVESGYSITIDGKFGTKTRTALKAFQASCKIEVDGKCGPATRAKLIAA